MNSAVLAIENLSKKFAAVKACKNVSLTLQTGELHALIGPNGAGKSTLISQIAGTTKPDEGIIRFLGKDITRLNTAARARLGLGRSFQVSAVIPAYTVCDNILLALLGREQRAYNLFSCVHSDLSSEAKDHAERTNLLGRFNTKASELSHGERRRLELSMALALKPKAFLLDEPMAGLGNEGAGEMTAFLAKLKHEAPILLVEHDMDAVFELADRISVLVYGEIIATGTVDEIRGNKDVQRAYLGEEEFD